MWIYAVPLPFVFEQAKGYVKALKKLPSRALSLREVLEYSTESYRASGKRLKIVLKFCLL
jgi:hypothetical protein